MTSLFACPTTRAILSSLRGVSVFSSVDWDVVAAVGCSTSAVDSSMWIVADNSSDSSVAVTVTTAVLSMTSVVGGGGSGVAVDSSSDFDVSVAADAVDVVSPVSRSTFASSADSAFGVASLDFSLDSSLESDSDSDSDESDVSDVLSDVSVVLSDMMVAVRNITAASVSCQNDDIIGVIWSIL